MPLIGGRIVVPQIQSACKMLPPEVDDLFGVKPELEARK